MPFQDQTLPCQGCGQPFVFTAGEQEFYEKKGFKEIPKRCRGCRDARKTGGPGQAQPAPPPRREAAPAHREEPRRRAPEVEVAGGRPRPRLGDGARIPGGEEALRKVVGGGGDGGPATPSPDAPAPLHAHAPVFGPGHGSGPGRRPPSDDDDFGNRAPGPVRRFGFGAQAPIDETDDDIGNRIDVEPGAGMSRGIREAMEPYARAQTGGPVDLACVACGAAVRVAARPAPGRPVFCRGCQ